MQHARGRSQRAASHGWIVIGAGPCGLATLDQLLSRGVPADDIAVVSPVAREAARSAGPVTRPTILSAFSSASVGGPLAKTVDGRHLSLESADLTGPLSRHWGASCLPMPATSELGRTGRFLEAHRTTVGQWYVNAESDGLKDLYPLTGELVGELPRKALAHQIVDGAPAGVVGHSRLAVRGESFGPQACDRRALCFHGCPNGSPWSADEQLSRMIAENPELTVLTEPAFSLTPAARGRVEVDFRTGVRTADRVLVAAGWRATAGLLSGRGRPVLGAKAELHQSTVIMSSIVFRSAASDDEFFRHFTFHDIVVPHVRDGQLAAMSQVYLPTHELAGRMLASAPRLTSPAIRAALDNKPISRGLHRALRHMGVAMTFFPGSDDWTASKVEQSLWRSLVPGDLAHSLRGAGGRVISAKKVVLAGGQSQHVGVWRPYSQVIPRLLNGRRDYLAGTGGPGRAVAVDASLLPDLAPGPHTSSAAACSRMLVDALVRDWS